MADNYQIESFIAKWAVNLRKFIVSATDFAASSELKRQPVTIMHWSKMLTEQASAVAAILAAAPIPQHPRDIARAIQGTNAKGVTPVLDALTAIGQARKLADGRYAA